MLWLPVMNFRRTDALLASFTTPLQFNVNEREMILCSVTVLHLYCTRILLWFTTLLPLSQCSTCFPLGQTQKILGSVAVLHPIHAWTNTGFSVMSQCFICSTLGYTQDSRLSRSASPDSRLVKHKIHDSVAVLHLPHAWTNTGFSAHLQCFSCPVPLSWLVSNVPLCRCINTGSFTSKGLPIHYCLRHLVIYFSSNHSTVPIDFPLEGHLLSAKKYLFTCWPHIRFPAYSFSSSSWHYEILLSISCHANNMVAMETRHMLSWSGKDCDQLPEYEFMEKCVDGDENETADEMIMWLGDDHVTWAVMT